MLRVRTINDAADFIGAPGDPRDYTDQITHMFDDGSSRPEWCFVVEDGKDYVGRIGFQIHPTMSNPIWLDTLPENELSAFGLDLPWKSGFETPGRTLFSTAADSLAGTVPDVLEIRTNTEAHPDYAARINSWWRLASTCSQRNRDSCGPMMGPVSVHRCVSHIERSWTLESTRISR